MDFYTRQDQARRSTTKLIVLFTLAVIGIVGTLNLAAYLALSAAGRTEKVLPDRQAIDNLRGVYPDIPRAPIVETVDYSKDWRVYTGITLVTLLIIGSGSGYKTMALSAGGPAVAQMMGGKLVDPNTTDPQKRMLMNVIEEMSIASGVPMPRVYVMENEPGINAFAAGKTLNDAVIGVTRGCIEKLNRDELQGVMAHEFSHILNGDMKLNIRLIAIIHGILVIALIGYMILRHIRFAGGGRRGKDDGKGVLVILAAGLVMLIIGYIGVFFGRLIQAAVSRQREFLADASAVQFTRNPAGISGALKKIGGFSLGANVNNANAVEAQHMFFASSMTSWLGGLFATHPPLPVRIKAIDPTWDGKFIAPPASVPLDDRLAAARMMASGGATRGTTERVIAGLAGMSAAMGQSAPSTPTTPAARMRLDPGTVLDIAAAQRPKQIRYAGMVLDSLPPSVSDAVHEPFSVRAVITALLLSDDGRLREHQLKLIGPLDASLQLETARLERDVRNLGPAARMPLVVMSLPALRQLSESQAKTFREVIRQLIAADDHVTPFEYALFRVVGRAIDHSKPAPAKYHSIRPVQEQIVRVLSALARRCSQNASAAFNAGMARLEVVGATPVADASDLTKLDEAMEVLTQCSAGVKNRIVDAAAHVVAADGEVAPSEAELLRAIAAVLDVPIPPFLPAGV
jgi:Zn-dependent protease with chaperone function/tellurite resistance protein